MDQDISRGAKIVERLKNFSEALEQGENISEKFTCHTTKADLPPQSDSSGPPPRDERGDE